MKRIVIIPNPQKDKELSVTRAVAEQLIGLGFSVFIDEKAETEKINEIGLKIQELEEVESIEYVSKEAAFESFKKTWGDTEILDGINDGSILRNSYQITLTDLSL